MPKAVEVLGVERKYDGFIKLDEVRLRHEKRDGTLSDVLHRAVVKRDDAVGVLLCDRQGERVLLIEQFRYPAYANGDPAWMLEIVAGMIEPGMSAEETARKELLEEIGYRVAQLERIGKFYLSPGGSTERIELYIGYLDDAERVADGGGREDEHEDIGLIELQLDQAMGKIASGEICDAKTIIALQHLALHRRT